MSKFVTEISKCFNVVIISTDIISKKSGLVLQVVILIKLSLLAQKLLQGQKHRYEATVN